MVFSCFLDNRLEALVIQLNYVLVRSQSLLDFIELSVVVVLCRFLVVCNRFVRLQRRCQRLDYQVFVLNCLFVVVEHADKRLVFRAKRLHVCLNVCRVLRKRFLVVVYMVDYLVQVVNARAVFSNVL